MAARSRASLADESPQDTVDPATGRLSALEGRFARFHPAAAVASVAVSGYVAICLVFAGMGLLDHVNRWFAGNRTSSMNGWTDHATKVADTSGILVVLVAAIIVLLVFRLRWDAVFLAVALGLELLTFLSINYLVGRPRPDVERLGSLPSTSSFPSGHAAAMLALYGGLAVIVSTRLRARVAAVVCWIIAVLATAAIGVARVYRGMHHPSDVAAGALLGLAVLGVALVAVRTGEMAAAERRRRRAPAGRPFDPELAP
ncbi:MAG: phosphatase PAP2 family protein [Actinobacteria bacterium]|nr:MAG: phosphatase PAP2 family protein [Actinomycetota bacterium]